MTRILSSTAAVATALAAGLLGASPWLAGRLLAVDPGLARTMLTAAPAAGLVAATAAVLLRQGHPAVRWAAATIGLAAVASSPAFLWRLAQPVPSLARTVEPPHIAPAPTPAAEAQTPHLAPAPASPASSHPARAPAAARSDRRPVAPRPGASNEKAGGRPDRLRLLLLGARPDRPAPGGPGVDRSSAEPSWASLSSLIREAPSDRTRQAERLATAIGRFRPDVVVLPDAWCAVHDGCLVDRLAQELGVHAAWAPASGSLRLLGFEEGGAILSRFPIRGAAASRWSPPVGEVEAGAGQDVRNAAGAAPGRVALRSRIAHPEAPFDVVGISGEGLYDPGASPGTESSPESRALGQRSVSASEPGSLPERLQGAADAPMIIAGDLTLPDEQATIDRLGQAGYRRLTADAPAPAEASGWPRRSSAPGSPPGPRTSQRPSIAGSTRIPTGSILYRPADTGWLPLWVETLVLADQGSTTADRHPALLEQSLQGSAAGNRIAARDLPARAGLLVEFQLPVPPAPHPWSGEWRTADADDVGLDPARLGAALDRIGELDGLHGILVARHGRLVAERYWRGASPNRLHNLKSTSKSILSALVGQAIDQGWLDLDQRIDTVLPEATAVGDPAKGEITVRHLLTMTSGLESTSFGGYGRWVASPNWVRSALARPLLAAPGDRFSYSTGGTHLLSATLARAAGQSSHDFAREHLFAPLDIGRSAWGTDRQGVHMGGNNLALLPRDMLKFGQLYLNRGQWGGRQVVPWQWVDRSTRPDLAGPRGRRRIYGGYGYLWWLRPESERGAYLASGYGGQYIYVAPADDMVVATISTEVSKGREWRRQLFGLIRDGVTGSVVDRYARTAQ